MNDGRPERLIVDRLATPIGAALLVTDERGLLRALEFEEGEATLHRSLRRQYGPLVPEPGGAPERVRRALDAYFAGDIAAPGGIAWATAGTPFQRRVWAALTEIPPGTTLSYGALAVRIGAPTAVRAVGHANGANPISVVVPCHRVIGTDGALTGYGGGVERKRWLLEHEGVRLPGRRRAS